LPKNINRKDQKQQRQSFFSAHIHILEWENGFFKQAISTDEAKRIIHEGSGTHFDPALVDIFMKVADDFAGVVKKRTY
jgi:hypothetical protein